MTKTSVLRKAIMERRAVVVPGCHDAFSAKVIEACGFEAIQISGFGLAGSLLAPARRRPGADEGRARPDLEHRAGREHPGDGRRRHRRRQRRQRRLDHRAADRDGRRGHEHRGPGVPEALRPHGGQGGDRRRGDGRQGEGLRRRPRPARPRLRPQRPHRRVRRRRARRGDPPLQRLPRRRAPTSPSSTASGPAPTSRRP